MVERQKAWKYSTIGLLAILAISISIPQAAAHITNNTQHMLAHIYNFVDGIESKTDNLPNDPADQSLIDEQFASIQSDTDDIQSSIEGLPGGGSSPKSARIHTTLNPPSGGALTQTILPFEAGKTYSGTITGRYLFSEGNIGNIFCDVSGVTLAMSLVDFQVNDPLNGINGGFTEVFTCESIRILVLDLASDGDSGPIAVVGTIQYFESTEVSEIGD